MKVAFRKITSEKKTFVLEDNGLNFECTIFKKSSNICILQGRISGFISLSCDLTGDDFAKEIEQELVLYISDGLWNSQSQFKDDIIDVIEFFDGFIDIKHIFHSEIELIKSDYYIKE